MPGLQTTFFLAQKMGKELGKCDVLQRSMQKGEINFWLIRQS